MLKSKIIKLLRPHDSEELYLVLKKWYRNSDVPNVRLIFELGVAAFNTKHYDEARDVFRRLDRLTLGLRDRYEEREVVLDESGNPQDFEGKVTWIKDDYNGDIACFTLKIGYPLYFRPIASPFTVTRNELVMFNIAFSYRGPRAVNIRKSR